MQQVLSKQACYLPECEVAVLTYLLTYLLTTYSPEREVQVALPHRLGRAAHVQPKAVPRVA